MYLSGKVNLTRSRQTMKYNMSRVNSEFLSDEAKCLPSFRLIEKLNTVCASAALGETGASDNLRSHCLEQDSVDCFLFADYCLDVHIYTSEELHRKLYPKRP